MTCEELLGDLELRSCNERLLLKENWWKKRNSKVRYARVISINIGHLYNVHLGRSGNSEQLLRF